MKFELHTFRITAATRLAIGLTMLCVSLLLVASFLGLLPNRAELEAKATTRVCESIALQLVATDPDDLGELEPVIENILLREPKLDSVGLRTVDGALLLQAGDHPDDPPAEGAKYYLTVPISQGNVPWATAEFRMRSDHQLQSYVQDALVLPKLVGFLAASSLLAFGLYLRRALKYLDPSAIVPERVRAAFDTMNEGVVLLDTKCQIALANRAFLELIGKQDQQVLGTELGQLGKLTTRDQDQTVDQIWNTPLKERRAVQALLCKMIGGDGQEHLVNVSAAPIRTNANNPPRGVLVTFDNVTEIERRNTELHRTVESLNTARQEIERKNQDLERLATTDPLTGVLNRRAFFERGEALLPADRRGGRETSVIILDIDHFKSVNDNHGHARGDEVLKGVSGILSRSVRASDILCRYGGEEFCILLPDTPEPGALTLAEDLRQRIANSTSFGFPVTASFGVATCTEQENLEQSIDRADQSLYQAKEGGRNRVVSWSAPSESEVQPSPPDQPECEPVDDTIEAAEVDQWVSIPAVMGLVSAMEYRDPGTAAHSRRVARLCVATAGSDLSPRDAFVFEVAALLHDIGKVGVPDSILLKPGKLTEEERQIISQHDIIGMDIVRSAYVFKELAHIIRFHQTHHENARVFDQSQPLRSLCARASLLGICNAYDAMTHDRPYRKAMSREDACAELRRAAPKQFDPKLVEYFIARQSLDGVASQAAEEGSNHFRVMVCVERLAVAVAQNDPGDVKAQIRQLDSWACRDNPEAVEKIRWLATLTRREPLETDLMDWFADFGPGELEPSPLQLPPRRAS